MAINRRNVLLGLGAIVGGGGALVGTGAFSSVSAAREVSVTTAGDASAYLTIQGDGEYVTRDNTTSDLIIDIGGIGTNGINQEAITKITDVLEITNNTQETSSNVTIGVDTVDPGGSTSPSPNGSAEILIQETTSGTTTNVALVTFTVDDASGDAMTSGSKVTGLSPGGKAYIDVTVDTTTDAMNTAENDGVPTDGNVTIVAEDV